MAEMNDPHPNWRPNAGRIIKRIAKIGPHVGPWITVRSFAKLAPGTEIKVIREYPGGRVTESSGVHV